MAEMKLKMMIFILEKFEVCKIFLVSLTNLSLKYKEYKSKKQILQESNFKIFIHNA